MNAIEKTPRRIAAANTFGTLGYLSIVFQWMWVLLLFASPFLSNDASSILQPQQPTTGPVTADISPELTPLLGVVAGIITIAVLVMTVITVIRLPKAVGKKAASASKSTARAVLPIILQHKKVSKKERLRLSYRIVLVLKAVLIITPLALLYFTPSIAGLTTAAAWALGILAATGSVFYFGIQLLIVTLGKIPRKAVW